MSSVVMVIHKLVIILIIVKGVPYSARESEKSLTLAGPDQHTYPVRAEPLVSIYRPGWKLQPTLVSSEISPTKQLREPWGKHSAPRYVSLLDH